MKCWYLVKGKFICNMAQKGDVFRFLKPSACVVLVSVNLKTAEAERAITTRLHITKNS